VSERRAIAELRPIASLLTDVERQPRELSFLDEAHFEIAMAAASFPTETTDVQLRPLQGLRRLKILNLKSTAVSDAGMHYVGRLTALEQLGLVNTRITDAGLAPLAHLHQLEGIMLTNTLVTDDGLAHLQGLPRLKQLWLYGTQVTDARAADFRRALPGCQIRRIRPY
jgi:hypothetical protein